MIGARAGHSISAISISSAIRIVVGVPRVQKSQCSSPNLQILKKRYQLGSALPSHVVENQLSAFFPKIGRRQIWSRSLRKLCYRASSGPSDLQLINDSLLTMMGDIKLRSGRPSLRANACSPVPLGHQIRPISIPLRTYSLG